MEIRQLRYVVAVADELHFGRAAERLGISQPALSQQIREIERELGGELFNRNRRQVRLTEAGRVLVEDARQLIPAFDAALASAQAALRGEAGRLIVGFIGATAAHDIVPDIIRVYRERHPEVVLELREMTSQPQIEALLAGEIQVGFLRIEADVPRLITQLLVTDTFIAALPEGHALGSRTMLDVADLAGIPFITFPRQLGAALRDQILAVFSAAGFTPEIAQEAVLFHTTLGLVASGIGFALVPGSAVAFQRRGVIYRPIRDMPIELPLKLAHRSDLPSPLIDRFVETARDVASTAQAAQGLRQEG